VFAADIAGVWLLAVLGLALAGGVVAAGWLPALGRFAPAVGFPLAFTVVGLVGLWVGHRSITLGLVAGLAVLGIALVATVRRTDWQSRFRRGRVAYAVFLAAFLFVLGLRLLDPAVDPGSGEKFLDFGLLRAHVRATALPAEDIWFAGEPFSYYYGGHFAYALLARLTGTSARYAYNLALATSYAALVTAAYGLAGAIARRWDAGRPAALAAVFSVGLASNLTPSARMFIWALPDAVPDAVTAVFPRAEGWLTLHPLDFHYWRASRVVPETINEFPLFAYLNGDLHAHMLAAPVSLLAIACLYTYVRTPGEQRRQRRVLAFGVVPAVAGFVAATNVWSLPVLAGLTWLTLSFAPTDPATLLPAAVGETVESRSRDGDGIATAFVRATAATLVSTVVVALAVAWSLPVWLVSEGAGRGLGLFPTRSPLWSLLLVHGVFLAVFGPYLWRRLSLSGRRCRVAIVGVALLAVAATAVRAAGVVLFAAFGIAAWTVLGRKRHETEDRRAGYETVLALGAFGLLALVELVYLQEPAAPGRFNTVFKLYAAVWVLLGVAAAVVVGRYFARRRPVGFGRLSGVDARPLVVALLLCSTGIYAVGATVEWTTYQNSTVRTPDDPTLDALAFAHERYPERMAAIEWLDSRSGTPTLLSAPGAGIGDSYRWVNAPSSLTGLPTVAGWRHEVGYRGADAYWDRVRDVRRMFTGNRTVRHRLLGAYDVRFVYEGPVERQRYGTAPLGTDPALSVVYESETVTLYRVDQSAP
jgi:YYY domain-containing protein